MINKKAVKFHVGFKRDDNGTVDVQVRKEADIGLLVVTGK